MSLPTKLTRRSPKRRSKISSSTSPRTTATPSTRTKRIPSSSTPAPRSTVTSQSGSNKLNVSKNSEESVDSVSICFKTNMSNMNMSNDKKVCQFCETTSCTASCKTSCESKTLSPDFKNQKKIHLSEHTNLHF